MSHQQNQAAILDGVGKTLRVGRIETKKPGPGEILVRPAAVAINTVDVNEQNYGVFYQSWPAVLGGDVAGEVVEVGEGVAAPISVGSGVVLLTHHAQYKTTEYGGFQELVISPESLVFPLPEGLSYQNAVVLPLALATSATGFFQSGSSLSLGISGLKQKPPKKNGKTVLMWGGSSSVGSQAIQLAVASGYDIIFIASPRNFGLVRELGARAFFDYNSPNINKIVDEIHTDGKFTGVFDAIGTHDSELGTAQVTKKLGRQRGKTIITVPPPIDDAPEGIAIKFTLGIFHKDPDVGEAVFKEFLPRALESGQVKPFPPSSVIGKGIDAIQGGVDRLRAGVSATKVIVAL